MHTGHQMRTGNAAGPVLEHGRSLIMLVGEYGTPKNAPRRPRDCCSHGDYLVYTYDTLHTQPLPCPEYRRSMTLCHCVSTSEGADGR